MNKEKIQKQNIGNAGEYYIASRLSALNFVATITLGRAEKYDILAVNPKGNVVKVSVKTTKVDNSKSFTLQIKDENGATDDFYYAFVKLNSFIKEPDFWIIPSKVVCPTIKIAHKKWEITPGKNGKPHSSTSTIRKLPIEIIKSNKNFYPKNWGEEVNKYYKNLNQLL